MSIISQETLEEKNIERNKDINGVENYVPRWKDSIQAYLGDIVGSVSDHRNKANITIK